MLPIYSVIVTKTQNEESVFQGSLATSMSLSTTGDCLGVDGGPDPCNCKGKNIACIAAATGAAEYAQLFCTGPQFVACTAAVVVVYLAALAICEFNYQDCVKQCK